MLDGASLDMGEVADQFYCTIIYNDEVHTFEDVIKTIVRAADCSREEAIGFATLIDREGRCIVRCGGFQVKHNNN